MIESVTIRDFRSYKDVFIELHPGLNVFVGRNDSGKSNILRAINWVVNNRPSGEDVFPLYWEGRPRVSIDVDKKLVERFKSKTENLYILTHADGKEDVHKAFGQGVPEQIKKHLNISPLNINFQLDSPFLLGKTPSEVARHYNELVNLEIIDKAISNIASALWKEKKALENEKKVEAAKAEELKAFDWLPNAESELIKLEKLNVFLEKLDLDSIDLNQKVEEIKKLDLISLELHQIIKHDDVIAVLIQNKKDSHLLRKEHTSLYSMFNTLIGLDDALKVASEIIQFENVLIDLTDKKKTINQITDKQDELSGYISDLNRYQLAEKQYKNVVSYATEVQKLLSLDGIIEQSLTEHNVLHELLEKLITLSCLKESLKKELSEWDTEFNNLMPDSCPLCGRSCDCSNH